MQLIIEAKTFDPYYPSSIKKPIVQVQNLNLALSSLYQVASYQSPKTTPDAIYNHWQNCWNDGLFRGAPLPLFNVVRIKGKTWPTF